MIGDLNIKFKFRVRIPRLEYKVNTQSKNTKLKSRNQGSNRTQGDKCIIVRNHTVIQTNFSTIIDNDIQYNHLVI